jgi:[citrate (pro-3S)-lyase] ligase
VRKLLAAGDLHAAAPLVPKDTLYYLQDLQAQRRAKPVPQEFESAQSGE